MVAAIGSRLRLAVLGSAALVPSVAAAATYQVGPDKPYPDLQSVADLLAPGDVVEVDGGVTYPGGVAFWNAGDPGDPITIRGIAVGGMRPVLEGGGNTIEAGGNHYVFEGLDITGGTNRCFYHHAHDVVLRDSVVHDCPAQGILGADSDSGSMLLEYVEVHHCGGGLYDHQIYMATDETANPGSVFRMQHCWVHDANGGNNVKSRAERNEIYYNWIEGAVYHELELIGPDGQDPTLAREDSDVVGNVLVKTMDFSVVRFGGDGTGETFGRYRFVANTVVAAPAGAAVFRLFDGIESLEAHDNVFVGTDGGAVNLLRQVEANWADGEAIFGSHNWVAEGSTNLPASWTDTILGTDPGLVDLAALDVHPLEASPLVDMGLADPPTPAAHPFPTPLPAPLFHPPPRQIESVGEAIPRMEVGPLDIGAYEYGVAPPGGDDTGGSSSGGADDGESGGGTSNATGESGGTTVSGSATATGTGGGSATTAGTVADTGSGGEGGAEGEGGSGSGCGCRSTGTAPLAWLVAFACVRRRARRVSRRARGSRSPA